MSHPYARNDTEVSTGMYISQYEQPHTKSLMSTLLEQQIDEITESTLMNKMFEEQEQGTRSDDIENPFNTCFRGIDTQQFNYEEQKMSSYGLDTYDPFAEDLEEEEAKNAVMNNTPKEECVRPDTNSVIQDNMSNNVVPEQKEESETESKKEMDQFIEEIKQELKEESKEEPKEEHKEESKEESKEEHKKEPKEEHKEEPKEESKEEPKEEPQEEPKEEPQEEHKEESKEEPKEEPKTIESVLNFSNIITKYKEEISKLTQKISEEIKESVNELKTDEPSLKFKRSLFLDLNHKSIIIPSTKQETINNITCRICLSTNNSRPNYKLLSCNGVNCLTCKYNITYHLCEKCMLNKEILNHKFERVTTVPTKLMDSQISHSEKYQSKVENANDLTFHINNESEKTIKVVFKNTGTDKWTTAFVMEYTKESDFRKALICLPKDVQPNATVEFEIKFTELNLLQKGTYCINLRLQDKNKKFFGDSAIITLIVNK